MLRLREKIATYQEWYFLIYILIVHGMHSIGKGNFDIKWLAAIAFGFLALKLLTTNYTRKEIIIICVIGCFIAFAFYKNSDKMLLLTYVSLIGVKNVSLRKVFFWGLWSRVVLMVLTVALTASGILENTLVSNMPKYSVLTRQWKGIDIYSYGFVHPNYLYLGVFSVAILALLVYGNRMKWYGYVVLTGMMYFAYYFLRCRTGWYTWLLMLLLIGLYYSCKRFGQQKPYLYLLTLAPVILLVVSTLGVVFYYRGNAVAALFNDWLTGRFSHVYFFVPVLFRALLAQSPWNKLDMGYMYCVYNYGWILTILLVAGYMRTMWLLIRQKKEIECLALVAMAGYLFCEATPISVSWNLSILLCSTLLFQSEKQEIKSEEINQ